MAIMGDGAIGYTMIEIQTAIQHNLPIVVVVLDNEAWGAEKAYQQEFFGGRLLGAEIRSPRYDKFAELCGGKGIWVDGPRRAWQRPDRGPGQQSDDHHSGQNRPQSSDDPAQGSVQEGRG